MTVPEVMPTIVRPLEQPDGGNRKVSYRARNHVAWLLSLDAFQARLAELVDMGRAPRRAAPALRPVPATDPLGLPRTQAQTQPQT